MADFPYGYCGMPCALCTRYRAEGASRCPGCSQNGYYTDTCKVHHCCQGRELAHCGLCPEFPCARLGKMGEFSDLRTDHAKERACRAVAAEGFDAWHAAYAERAALLTEALANYNNGRMKRYLCELFLQRDMGFLRAVMRRAEGLSGTPKERGAAFQQLVREENDMCGVCKRIRMIQEGTNPYFVRELKTGYAVIGDHQRFPGYTLFLCKRHATELHQLEPTYRDQFLHEMALVAEAACRAFAPDKMNYELLGNGETHLHWHLFPRRAGDTPAPGPVWMVPLDELFADANRPSEQALNEMKDKLGAQIDALLAKEAKR